MSDTNKKAINVIVDKAVYDKIEAKAKKVGANVTSFTRLLVINASKRK